MNCETFGLGRGIRSHHASLGLNMSLHLRHVTAGAGNPPPDPVTEEPLQRGEYAHTAGIA